MPNPFKVGDHVRVLPIATGKASASARHLAGQTGIVVDVSPYHVGLDIERPFRWRSGLHPYEVVFVSSAPQPQHGMITWDPPGVAPPPWLGEDPRAYELRKATPESRTCTCRDLLWGHSNDCPYILSKEAA